ncbi:glycosyltransferase [Ramlibacter sp. USB13]|uniref:Glycosyltransferase n=1 Tax=Ramlibacter cellulosilyticus TaxID=2764187 RepID=A0A923SH67_9BURK|nr:glycosyltransferase [Ramlibacter cellulosilyticus]MBC5785622.1 glycosyltransferase [Ramlibacter cellulosilyticus]
MQRFLFIHQNFPAQFVHVARALAQRGHEVVALGIEGRPVEGVRFLRYEVKAPQRRPVDPVMGDFETKAIRSQACAAAMERLKAEGFRPDIIVAHPGWGEAMFCKDVFPQARLVVFAEFFYNAEGADYLFDPEFSRDTVMARARLRIKNTVHLHALNAADTIYSPTRWQRDRLPPEYRARTQVMFDGIDTRVAAPNPDAWIQLAKAGVRLARGDEVITFVNRNLEPYRGFHVFMRALPEILERRPNAHCVIVGRDAVSYGSPPAGGGTWREAMLREVGARLPKGRVHFLGGLPYADYLRVLQVSACHVYLTYPFVLSWSCMEALSTGCTVVASRTGPVEEVITDGVTGRLFDFFDVPELSRSVIDVLENPEAHAHLGRNARESMQRTYDIERCLAGQMSIVAPRLGDVAPAH